MLRYDAAVELDADIAMLSVTWPIAMNEYTQPACKADDYPRDYAGATSVVSGWGTLSSGKLIKTIQFLAVHINQLIIFTNWKFM